MQNKLQVSIIMLILYNNKHYKGKMKVEIPISKDKYSAAMLTVVNCWLRLTDYELNIISKMIDNNIIVLDVKGREKLRGLTGKSVGSTNNYIKKLKDKGMIESSPEGLVLSDKVLKPIRDRELNVLFHIN